MPKQAEEQDAKSVMQKILSEDVVSLAEARSEIFKVMGKRPDKATMHRWVYRGVGGVRLLAVRLGREMFTSKQEISRFIEARTASIGK